MKIFRDLVKLSFVDFSNVLQLGLRHPHGRFMSSDIFEWVGWGFKAVESLVLMDRPLKCRLPNRVVGDSLSPPDEIQ